MIDIELGKHGVQAISKDLDYQSHIDVTTHTGDQFVIPGLRRAGKLTIHGRFEGPNEITDQLLSPKAALETQDYRVMLPDGTDYHFTGIVTSSGVHANGGFEVQIQPTGQVKEKTVQNKKMPTGLRKFYVGSNNVTADWTHATLKDAEAHAQRLLEKGGQEEAFIVEIKRVVRKKPTPIEVTNFKGAK